VANFEKAYNIILKNEGGYANDPNDIGGETYKGIARNFNPKWKGWAIIDAYKEQFGKIKHNSRLSLAGLDDLVKDIYKEKYWDKMRGDELKNDGFAINLFDFFINSERGAGKAVQLALIRMGFCIKADGVIGPNTIKAINNADPVKLNGFFNEERIAHYKNEVIRKPSQAKYLAGWLGRVHRFETLLG
jgi:lysozyme family protein